MGLWFEQQRYEAIFQFAGDCVTADYGLNDDGSIRVVNSMVRLITQTPSSDTGRAVLSFPDANPLPARLNVTFAEGREYFCGSFELERNGEMCNFFRA